MTDESGVFWRSERVTIRKVWSPPLFSFEVVERTGLPLPECHKICNLLIALEHPHILKVERSTATQEKDHTVITTYYAGETARLKECVQTSHEHFSPENVDVYSTQLLKLLAYLESCQLHHHYICPEFLFIQNNKLKLGFFFSSMLKEALEYELESRPATNMYSAEAIATGVVILYMARCKPPFELVQDLSTLRQLLSSLSVSNFAKTLLDKLFNPTKSRLDFEELCHQFRMLGQEMVTSAPPSTLLACEECGKLTNYVLNCGHRFCEYHYQPMCPICSSMSKSFQAIISTVAPEDQRRTIYESINRHSYRIEELRVETIAERRYPLFTLARVYPSTETMAATLEQYYTSWRRSVEDGHSFYRCVGVAWLERLFRSATNIERQKWIQRLEKRKNPFCADAKSAPDFFNIIAAIKAVEKQPENRRMEALQVYLLSAEFDESLIKFTRRIVGNFIQSTGSKPQHELNFLCHSALTQGNDSPTEFDLQCAGEAFRYPIHLYRPEDTTQLSYEEVESIAIVCCEGCILLYSISMDYYDGYDLADHTYSPRLPPLRESRDKF